MPNMAEMNFEGDDFEQRGIASPVDGWELVSSSPTSPTSPARAHISSWEPSASDSTRLLQDDHNGRETTGPNAEFLSASMVAMADKQLENKILSEKLNVLEHAEDTFVCTISEMPEMVSDMPLASDNYDAGDSLYVYEDDGEGKVDDNSMIYCSEIMGHDDQLMYQDEQMQTGMGENSRGLSCEVAKAYHDMSSTHSTSASSSPMKQWASPVHVPMALHDMDKSSSIMHAPLALVPARRDAASQADDGASHSPRIPVPFNGSRRLIRFPCAAWIWTQFQRWQHQLTCAKSFWSVALAAAVMGILVIGRSWQRLQVQNRLLQTQISAKDKKITQLTRRLMEVKETLCKTRQVPVIWAKPSLQVPQDHI